MEPNLITIVTAAGTALITKGIEAPINSFNNIWNGAFGYKLEAWAEKRKDIAFENVNKLKQDIADNLNKIPQENLKNPEIGIVGPAIESAKYYCDEDEIRQMFANIITSSMDDRIIGLVHQSFVEVLKQMNRDDALFLKNLNEVKPICDIVIKIEPEGELNITPYYFVSPDFPDYEKNAFTITNLLRLGLIETPGEFSSLTDKSNYEYIRNSEYVKKLEEIYSPGIMVESQSIIIKELILKESFFKLTPYGKQFKTVVID